jgi:tetratricopeptide (TPR) repeat protein
MSPPYRRVLTGEDARQVERLEKQITDLRRTGKYAEAQAPAREFLQLRGRGQGENHWQTADARRLLQTLEHIAALPPDARAELTVADQLYQEVSEVDRRGRYREAVPLLQRILEVRQRHLGPDSPEVGRALNDLAFFLNESGKYAEAEPLDRQALALYRKVLGEEHPGTANSYNNLAMNLARQGRYTLAQPLFEKALALRRRLLGEGHPLTATSYNNLAALRNAQGQFEQAEPLFRQALASRRKQLGEEHLDTAQSYGNLASNLGAQGRYAEAEPLHRRALALRQTLLGAEHPETALGCNSLALNLHAQGRYAEAEPLLHQALAVRRTLLGEAHPDTLRSYNNLAYNLGAQGNHAEAEPLFRRVLALRQQGLGAKHPDTATSYNNLAANLDAQRRYAEAEPLHRRALALRRTLLGAEHPDTIRCCNNLGYNLYAQDRYGEAEPLLQQALALWRKRLGEGHPDTATSYNNVALNRAGQGQYAQAEPLFRQALAIRQKVFGDGHRQTAASYGNLAHTLHAQGRYEQAETYWAEAIRGFDVARLRSSASGLGRAAFAADAVAPWPNLAACRARAGKGALAWNTLEAGLARGLLDDLAGGGAPALTRQEQARQQALSATLDRLDRQIAAPLPAGERTDAVQTRFEGLVEQRQAAQAELAQLAAALASRQVYDLRRVQAQLAANVALVAWVDGSALTNAADANGEYWGCVVRRTGEPGWVRLPGSGPGDKWTEDDDDLPGRLRLALRQRTAAREDLEDLRRQAAAQRLAPLLPQLAATPDLPPVRHLVVPAAWRMAGIPLEVLTDRYTVSYAPSATLFARGRERQQPHRPPGEGRLLALGDPVFGRSAGAASSEPTDPEYGVLIVQVTPQSNGARSGLRSGDVLLRYGGKRLNKAGDLGAAATATGEARPTGSVGSTGLLPIEVWRDGTTMTLNVGPGPLGIRLAPQPAAPALRSWREAERVSRASRRPSWPSLPGTRAEIEAIARLFERPSILLGPDASRRRLDQLAQGDQLRQFRYLHLATHVAVDTHRALQSALILTSEPPTGPEWQVPHDRLTATEIMMRWKLDADLVVLSACQSGLGRYAGGEGYLGFAQALFLAGARSLVLSLWQVDDTATALLMARFYQNLLGKRPGLAAPLPKADALREAKHWLRDLTAVEVEALQDALRAGQFGAGPLTKRDADGDAERPYAHPHYWAAFILVGDPS